MRPGQRVVVLPTCQHGAVVDFPTEERTRVLLDGELKPKVFDNANVETDDDGGER